MHRMSRRIAAHRRWVVIRLVLGCSLGVGLMGPPSASVIAITRIPQPSVLAREALNPSALPLTSGIADEPKPAAEALSELTLDETVQHFLQQPPTNTANNPRRPEQETATAAPSEDDPDASERVVGRVRFDGSPLPDGGIFTPNARQLIAYVALQAMTATTNLTVTVSLPAGIEYVASSAANVEYDAGARQLRWRAGAASGIGILSQLTLTVNAPATPSQIFLRTTLVGPALPSQVVRLTPVWVGSTRQDTIASATETTVQATDRVRVTFPTGALNADTPIQTTGHVANVADPALPSQLQLPFSFAPDVVFNKPVRVQINLAGLLTAGMLTNGNRPALFFEQPISTTRTFGNNTNVPNLFLPASRWVEVASSFDPTTNQLTAELSHFSNYQVSIKQPSDPEVWKLKANRGDVGLFRGEMSYATGLALPPMADGLQPNLTLRYSSASADQGAGDSFGLPEGTHASLGKGWSLDLPRVTARVISTRYMYVYAAFPGCPYNTTAPAVEAGVSVYLRYIFVQGPCSFGITDLVRHAYTLSFGGRTYNLKPGIAGDVKPILQNGQIPAGVYATEEHAPLYILHCSQPLPCSTRSSGSIYVAGATQQPFWQLWTPDGARYVFGLDEQSYAKSATSQVWLLRRVFAANRDSAAEGRWSVDYNYGSGDTTRSSYRYACNSDCAFPQQRAPWLRPSRITYGNSIRVDGAPADQRYTVSFSYADATSDRITDIRVAHESAAGNLPLRNYAFERPAPGYNLERIHEQHWNGSAWVALPSAKFNYSMQDQATLITSLTNGYGLEQTIQYDKTDFNGAHVVASLEARTGTGWRSRTRYTYAGACTDKQGQPCFNPTSNIESFAEGFNRWVVGPGSGMLIGHAWVTATVQDDAANGNTLAISQHRFYTDYQRLGREHETRTLAAPNQPPLAVQQMEYRVVNGPIIDFLPMDTWHTALVTSTQYPGDVGAQPYRQQRQTYYYEPLPQPGYVRVMWGYHLREGFKGVRLWDLPSTYATSNEDHYLLATQLSGTHPVYLCGVNADGVPSYLSKEACGGAIAGYAYDAPTFDTHTLYRCPDLSYGVTTCQSGPLLGYFVDSSAIYGGFNAVLGQVWKITDADAGQVKTVTELHYTDSSITTWLVKPVSETVQDAGGNLLNQATVYYEGTESYIPLTSNPADKWVKQIRPYKPFLTTGQVTRVDTGSADDSLTERYGYDTVGNPIRVTDTRGFTTRAGYDLGGYFLLSVTNAISQTGHYEYFGVNGQALQNGWSATWGLLKRKISPNGDDAAAHYTYDEFGRLADVVQPGDSTTYPTLSYRYSDSGVAFAPPLKVETLQRETANCATCVHSTLAFYDGAGQLLQQRAEAGDGLISSKTSNATQQRVVSWGYDALGRTISESVPISITDPIPNGPIFNSYAPPNWAQGLASHTVYDALSRPVRVLPVDGTEAQSAYQGNTVTTTDANGHKREQTADAFGRLMSVVEFSGTQMFTTGYGYDAKDNLIGVTDALGHRTVITYDVLNRKTAMSDPDMGLWQYAYDKAGNLMWQTDAKGQPLRFEYDALGRLLDKHSYQTLWSDSFDAPSAQWELRNANVQSSTLAIAPGGSATERRPITPGQGVRIRFQFSGSSGGKLAFSHGASTRRRSFEVSLGGHFNVVTRTWTQDEVTPLMPGRAGEWYDAAMTVDADGDFLVSVWRTDNPNERADLRTALGAEWRGLTWTFSVSTSGNAIVLDDYAGVRVAKRSQFFYDEASPGAYNIGQRTRTLNSNATSTWRYDARGRMTDETKHIGGLEPLLMRYGYDSANRAISTTLPNGEGVLTEFNQAMGPARLRSNRMGDIVSGAQYNALGKPSQLRFGNALNAQYRYWGLDYNAGARTAYGRLRQICVSGQACADGETNALLNLAYTYDAIGNITEMNDRAFGNQTATFGYDALDRLTRAKTSGGTNGYDEGYAYDAVGNFMNKGADVHRYDDAAHIHAVTHVNNTQVAWYDANGNMTRRVEGSTWFFQEWDANNRLTVVTNTSTSDVTRFFYGADGERVKRVAPDGTTYTFGANFELFVPNGRPFGNSTHSLYLPLAHKPGASTVTLGLALCSVVAHAPNCTVTTHYGFGGQRVALHEQTPTSDAVYWLHGDHLGSASLVTDKDGKKVSELRYKPYGETRFSLGNSHTERRYTSQRSEEKWLGALYDYGARFYSVGLGRFVSADSVVPRPDDLQAFNRYAAMRNNPLNRVDPTGHADCDDRNKGCPYKEISSNTPTRQFLPPLNNIVNKKRKVHQKLTKSHVGVDYDEAPNTDIVSSGYGIVIVADACSARKCDSQAGKKDASVNAGYGNVVIIEYPASTLPTTVINDLKIGEDESVFMLYGHLAKAPEIMSGDIVQPGMIIGQVGSTGNSTGPHLHLEIRIGKTASLQLGTMCGKSCSPTTSDSSPRFKAWYKSQKYASINPENMNYYFSVSMPLALRPSE